MVGFISYSPSARITPSHPNLTFICKADLSPDIAFGDTIIIFRGTQPAVEMSDLIRRTVAGQAATVK